MKKVRYMFVFLLMFFINISLVSATDEISSIDIKLSLDKKGTGHIEEVWKVETDSDIEFSKSVFKIGKITNFTVKDETNFIYKLDKSWDKKMPQDRKQKSGIIDSTNNIILSWSGISGSHVYTISYDVKNMINNVADGQILFWKFINSNMRITPNKFLVTVSGPLNYDNNISVYGNGFNGSTKVENGVLQMKSNDDSILSSSQYGVLLVEYPLKTFTSNHIEKYYERYDDYYSAAQSVGFFIPVSQSNSFDYSILGIIGFIVIEVVYFVISSIVNSSNGSGKSKVYYNIEHKEIDYDSVNFFRDIPCDYDIFKAYFLCEVYDLYKKKEDIIGVFILKWVIEKKVTIIKSDSNDKVSLQLYAGKQFDSEKEKQLYYMLVSASEQMILKPNCLKKWGFNHNKELYYWFKSCKQYAEDKYIEEGHVKKTIIDVNNGLYKLELDDYLYEEAKKLIGLKKFLIEFSRMEEKQVIEVKLWEYYLVFSQLFGISKTVIYQFRTLYPEIETEFDIDMEQYEYADDIVDSSELMLYTSLREYNRRRNSISNNFLIFNLIKSLTNSNLFSGLGGGSSSSSSGGGGGGSFGGGSGGGTR